MQRRQTIILAVVLVAPLLPLGLPGCGKQTPTPTQSTTAQDTALTQTDTQEPFGTPESLARYVYDCIQRNDFEAFKSACITENDLAAVLQDTPSEQEKEYYESRIANLRDGVAETMLRRDFERAVGIAFWDECALLYIAGQQQEQGGRRYFSHIDVHASNGRFIRLDSVVYINSRWAIGDDGPLSTGVTAQGSTIPRIAEGDLPPEHAGPRFVTRTEIALVPWPGWRGHDPAQFDEALVDYVAHLNSIVMSSKLWADSLIRSPQVQATDWYRSFEEARARQPDGTPGQSPRYPNPHQAASDQLAHDIIKVNVIPDTLRIQCVVSAPTPEDAQAVMQVFITAAHGRIDRLTSNFDTLESLRLQLNREAERLHTQIAEVSVGLELPPPAEDASQAERSAWDSDRDRLLRRAEALQAQLTAVQQRISQAEANIARFAPYECTVHIKPYQPLED